MVVILESWDRRKVRAGGRCLFGSCTVGSCVIQPGNLLFTPRGVLMKAPHESVRDEMNHLVDRWKPHQFKVNYTLWRV